MDQLIKQNIPQECSKEINTLTLLSFNTGLLEYRFFGAKLYQNPPFTQQRLLYLPAALLSSGADILALQELYDAQHVSFLLERVSASYPYYGRVDTGSRIALHNGLMMLSKYPILCSRFHPLTQVTPIEWIFGSKGILEVSVDIPGLGIVTFLNIHMASGAVDPESTYVEAVRNREILQLLRICSDAGQRGEIPVVIGDLNADPELCASNYKAFLEEGWIDSWLFSSSHMDPYSFVFKGLRAATLSKKMSLRHSSPCLVALEAKRIRDLTYWLINAPHPSASDFVNELMACCTTQNSKGEMQMPASLISLLSVASPPMLWYASVLMDDILNHCYHHSYRQQRHYLSVIRSFRKAFSALFLGKQGIALNHRSNISTFMTTVSDGSCDHVTLFTPDLCEPLIDMSTHVTPLAHKMTDTNVSRSYYQRSKSSKALASLPSFLSALSMLRRSNFLSVSSYEGELSAPTLPALSLISSLPSLPFHRTNLPGALSFPSKQQREQEDEVVSKVKKKVRQEPQITLSAVTWDPRNPLNAIGPHRHCHGLRSDYIFLPPPRFAQQLCHFIPFNAAILFQTPHVTLPSDQWCKAVEKVTISDHYAVFVELRRRQSFQAF